MGIAFWILLIALIVLLVPGDAAVPPAILEDRPRACWKSATRVAK